MKKSFPALVLSLICIGTLILAISFSRFSHGGWLARAFVSTRARLQSERRGAGDVAREVRSAVVGPHSAPRPQIATIRAHAVDEATSARETFAAALLSSPAVFERAADQNTQQAQFVGQAAGMQVALTSGGINVQVTGANRKPAGTLRIRLRGSGPLAWQGEDQAGESNYFFGNNPAKWRTHVARFQRVEAEAERGVQFAVYRQGGEASAGRGIEYDLHTDSRADPARLRLELSGANDLQIDRGGDLVMRVAGRELRMEAPAIYEQVSAIHTHRKMTSSPRTRKSASSHTRPRGARRETMPRRSSRGSPDTERRRVRRGLHDNAHSPRKRRRKRSFPVPPLGNGPGSGGSTGDKEIPPAEREYGHRIAGGYVLEADGSVGFWIGKHNPKADVVIDPSLTLTYATFLGGTGADSINSMARDSAGNVYVAGTTSSAASFPESPNGIEGDVRGSAQLFIAKVAFSTTGFGTLQYLSFFGGSNLQAGGEVAVDANGNAAILGTTTSADYPVTDGSKATTGLTSGAGNDVVVSEIDPTGSNLVFSALFGGGGAESANAAAGTPLSSSLKIPAAQGGIAFDAAGNIYIASDTTSLDLPTTAGAYDGTFGGKKQTDGFIAEFRPQGTSTGVSDILYCSYLGTNSDGAVAVGGIAVDAATRPNVYIAGSTFNGTDGFPVKGAVQQAYGGGASDAFLMKIVPAGGGATDLIYATLLGGSGMDEALGVAVDAQTPANAYVVGATQSPSFPDSPVIAGPSTTLYPSATGVPAAQNAFLAVVAWNTGTQTASLQYFTYLGGSQQDAAESVAAPSPSMVYVSGSTTSYDFGWRDNAQPFNGAADAFVAKIDVTKAGTSSLLYATPLAGTFLTPGIDVAALGNSIAADGRGDVYVAGATTAANFPAAMTSAGIVNGFQQICASCQESPAKSDAFIAAIHEAATAAPALSFGSPKVDFGSGGVQIGTPGLPQPFSILNTGEAPLSFSATNRPSVTGANAGDFSITVASGAGCPQPLAPGQICQAQLSFVPSAAGKEGALVSITDNAPGSPHLLEVTGVGVGPFSASPPNFAFGDVPVNTTSQPIVVTVTAGVQTTIQSVQGPSGAPFLIANQGFQFPVCGTVNVLTPGQSCDIGYAFQPTAAGAFQAELDVTAQINGSPVVEKLPMTGTGVAAVPLPIALPNSYIFRTTPLGSPEIFPIVLSNSGTAALVLTQAIGFTGANAGDFSQTNGCPSSIAPGSSCTVSVEFNPQTIGNKSASLAVYDNAPGSPQLIALAGTAIPPTTAQVAPASWNFGSQDVGTTSAQQPITITNAGPGVLNFTAAIGISGANPADFQETNNCPTSLAVGSSCTVLATFSPQAASSYTADIDISNNAAGSPQAVPLAGTGAVIAQAAISPASLNFGSQISGTQSSPQSISVKSSGSAGLAFTSIALSGPNAADFVESDNCLVQASVAPNNTCTVFVTFSPQAPGSKTANLVIADNAPNSPQTVAITGTAVSPPQVQLSSSSLDFGSVSVGTQSAAKTLTLTNTGGAALVFSQAIGIGGTNQSDYTQTSNCTVSLAPGSTCTVSVSFAPKSAAAETATLSIYDNVSGSPQVVALTGTGYAQPSAQVLPSSWNFGSDAIGNQSAPEAITVTSAGPGQPLQITKITIAEAAPPGATLSDFSETDNCSGPITASCVIHVTFTPACANTSAARSATLTIVDNGATPTQTVALSGTAAGDFCLLVSSSSLNQTVSAGTTAIFQPISAISVGSFNGGVNLACSSNPSGPACSFSPSATLTISPNQPVQFQVQAATATSAAAVSPNLWTGSWPRQIFVPLAVIAVLVLLGVAGKRGGALEFVPLTAAVFLFACFAFVACGGGSGDTTANASSNTPPQLSGPYNLTVTASEATETQTLSLHLNVTP